MKIYLNLLNFEEKCRMKVIIKYRRITIEEMSCKISGKLFTKTKQKSKEGESKHYLNIILLFSEQIEITFSIAPTCVLKVILNRVYLYRVIPTNILFENEFCFYFFFGTYMNLHIGVRW